MIDKKKLKDVMKKQDLKQEKPTDPSMTLDVKNEDVEAQIDLYLKEKTGENLNALIELMRTRRVLVPANLNDEKKPVPCLINSPKNGLDPDKSEVLVSSNLGASANENDGASAESIQMIQSLFMTQSVDVFFSDYDFFYSLGEFDYFTDIRECFPEEVLEKYKDDIVYVKSTETGKKYPIGIKLKGNAWVEKTGWYPDTCVVGLAAGLKNKDLAVKFIEENILED